MGQMQRQKRMSKEWAGKAPIKVLRVEMPRAMVKARLISAVMSLMNALNAARRPHGEARGEPITVNLVRDGASAERQAQIVATIKAAAASAGMQVLTADDPAFWSDD